MEKIYHPVSGEECYIATKDEKKVIDCALLHYIATSSQGNGVRNG